MNAVKRCLALIAATLVVGACGGDPTVDDAGTNLSIRATPGAVWVRNNASATVNIEAVDRLGGPAAGSWTVGTIVGPLTAALDTSYQSTTAGSIGVKSRFVVTPTAEGEGSVQFTGTGGSIVVPVRVAPDTGAFAATISTATPANGEVVTLTAPAGIVFTGGSTVRFFNGPLSRDTSNGGLVFPAVTALSADSSQLSFVAGPGANGVMRVTGIASRSTPALVTTARTSVTMTAPAVDTSNLAVAISNAAPTVLDTVVATIAAPYRFTRAGEPYSITPTSGGAAPIVVGYSPDSTQVRLIIPPGASGKLRSGRVVYTTSPTSGFAGRSAGTLTAAPPPPLNATFSNNAPAANAPITVTMPAGFKFRPTSAVSGTTGIPFVVLSRAADSNSVSVLPLPGYTGAVRITNVMLQAAPGFSLTLNTTGNITVGAAADLGSDDPANGGNPSFAAPTVTGNATAWYDLGTMGMADPTLDGGSAAQFYTLTVGTSGSYTFSVNWTAGSDVDATVMVKDGSYGALADLLSTSGLSGAKPESWTVNLTAGTTYTIIVIDWEGDMPGSAIVQVAV
ncbi:MAG TPA: hypothetical protein VHA75_06890, partial [Rugosimonospora sp.]|nr:hypothetical protein [Rugosimonospora sp.]